MRHTSYVGQDVLLQLTFLNSQDVPTEPSSLTYEVFSLTTNQDVIAQTSVAPTGTTQIIQLSGSVMQTTRNWLGREEMQVTITAVIPDTNATSGSITVLAVAVIELINIASPNGV